MDAQYSVPPNSPTWLVALAIIAPIISGAIQHLLTARTQHGTIERMGQARKRITDSLQGKEGGNDGGK